ncbi:MAG: twin-arginine translocase TatA/TatE family subunit [Chlorobi bacterium]|nr:twin-arginine translocase TatA/TatE family subunit [Chlorobiota bacterium]
MAHFIIAGMVGPWQIALIVIVVLLLFGGKKIPELMKGLGTGMKEFKKATKEMKEEVEMESAKDDEGEKK